MVRPLRVLPPIWRKCWLIVGGLPCKMRSYDLSFISNLDLYNHVQETVKKYRFQVDLAAFNKNLVDPIKLTFDAKIYHKTTLEVIEHEVVRQVDKSNTNHIGYFHQNIFRYIGTGWIVPKTGYDIVNAKLAYYVEMKNKHNTMNSSSSQKTYMRMQNTLLSKPKATCLLVEVIAPKSQNIPWQMSLDGKSIVNKKIRRVSIDKFYELVTGNRLAFMQLCQAIPKVLDDVVSHNNFSAESNSVVSELHKIDPNLLKSLYLLSFKQYEGFENLNV